MRFAVLARVVVAAASVTLVAASTLERREPGTCSSSSSPESSVPFCRGSGDCSGDGCECQGLQDVLIVGSFPDLGNGEINTIQQIGVSARKVWAAVHPIDVVVFAVEQVCSSVTLSARCTKQCTSDADCSDCGDYKCASVPIGSTTKSPSVGLVNGIVSRLLQETDRIAI